MDLNSILKLWPYLLGALAIGGLYVPDVYRLVSAWRAGKASAPPTTITGQVLETTGPTVGTLAEYLKAISNHCENVGDTAALEACDQIAPTLFHSKKLPEIKKPAA